MPSLDLGFWPLAAAFAGAQREVKRNSPKTKRIAFSSIQAATLSSGFSVSCLPSWSSQADGAGLLDNLAAIFRAQYGGALRCRLDFAASTHHMRSSAKRGKARSTI